MLIKIYYITQYRQNKMSKTLKYKTQVAAVKC
jgi:hypothetical protein